MTTALLIPDLLRDEGKNVNVAGMHVAYRDTKGIWTIGYGHTGPEVVQGLTWTDEHARAQLAEDVAHATGLLDNNIPWWRSLCDVRQDVLANMCFNMGWGDGTHGLSSFKNTLAKIKAGDYDGATAGMLNSQWARYDVGPKRSGRLAAIMQTGVRP